MYIDIGSVDNHTKKILYPKTLATIKAPSRAKQNVRSGDVLVSMTRPNLNAVAIVTPELDGAVASTGFHVLRGIDAEPAWLLYAVQTHHFVDSMCRLVQGALYPAVRPKDIRAFSIPLPPVAQQQRIVAEIEKQFTRLYAGVAILKRVQATLKRYSAAVLRAACEGRLVANEVGLHQSAYERDGADIGFETGADLLARILVKRRQSFSGPGSWKEPAGIDENRANLPKGWTWATMPQLGELARGKSRHRPRDDARLYGGRYPFIQTGDVRESHGSIRAHSQTYSEFGLQQSRLWPSGTLCITIAANIASSGILTFPACFPDSVVGFSQDEDHAITHYIELFVRTAKKDLERFAPATAQKNINLEVLNRVVIPLPPLAEQHRIVAEVERRLSVVDELDRVVNANLQRAKNLRQSILQRAFSGNL